MAQDNVAVVRRLLDAFNRGDFSALNELDAEAELQDEPRIPDAGWNYGYEGAVNWAVKLWQSFGELSLEIVEPIDAGESVVARWHASGKGKRSGIEVDMGGYCVFTLARGKVRWLEFCESEQEALGAVGVRPSRSTSIPPTSPNPPPSAPQ